MNKPVLFLFAIFVLGLSCSQDIKESEAVFARAPEIGTGIHNGDIGVKLWGPNNRITLSIGKSDVWDRRRFQQEPLLTLAEIKERAMSDNASMILDDRHYKSYAAYDFPCPKPVGQLIIGLPGVAEKWKVEVREDSIPGVMIVKAVRGKQQLDLRIYIHARRNLMVIEANAHQTINDLWIRLYRHYDTSKLGKAHLGNTSKKICEIYDYSKDEGNGPLDPPLAEYQDGLGWISQHFPGEPTFPDGFHYTFAALTTLKGVKMNRIQGQIELGTPAYSPNGLWSHENYIVPDYQPINEARGVAVTFSIPRVKGPFQILSTVVTSTDTSATLSKAKSRLTEAVAELPSTRFNMHVTGTKDASYPYITRKPGGFYGAVPEATWAYSSTSSVSPGPWTDFYCAQDETPWHGDFHFDEQQYSRHYFILNEEEKLEPYFQLIEKMLPLAQKNAADVYDCPGCAYPLVHFPIRTDKVFNAHAVWEQIMEITALNMKPFWEHYLYTGDKEFLQGRTYQLLKEGARFYTAYVSLEEDGYYHVFPTVSPEHWGLTKNFERNKDSQSALTLIKYHLRAASQAAKILDEDKEEREKWKHISEHMAPYPTYDTTGGPIFVDVLGAPPITYNISVPLTAIYWGDDITLESAPEVLSTAWRTIHHIEARNYIPLAICLLGEFSEGSEVGPENLLQSRGGWDMTEKLGGWIRVFPAVPDKYSGNFRNYRAIGAFEVSAEANEGNVTALSIYSHVGNLCQLINPWPGLEILVKEEGKSENVVRLKGSHVRFNTEPGTRYEIEPATD